MAAGVLPTDMDDALIVLGEERVFATFVFAGSQNWP